VFIWRRAEFRQGFWQRYGWLPKQTNSPLLVHAASMGELNAVADMIKQLLGQGLPVLVTTTTVTGRDRFQQLFADESNISHAYLPLDWGLAQRIMLARVKPRGLLLVETELWPNMLRLCHGKNIPVWLINGRLSQRSAQRYKRFAGLTKGMLKHLSRILVQDKASGRRFAHIGADKSAIEIMGSLKFDLAIPEPKHDKLAGQWLQQGDVCWVCGSTREGEEAMLLQTWGLMQSIDQGLLVLVPRHPQRFDEVADLCEQSGLPWQRFSQPAEVEQKSGRRVLLVDVMGLLMDFYRLADVTLVGGSLVDKGGHNPLEPAALGKPVLMGPHCFNFALVCELLQKAGNLQMVAAADLVEQVTELLKQPDRQAQMGAAGQHLIEQQRGSTVAYVERILAEFKR
jgi:3-deoxy-D-manno-octulosonic-acid transferase